MMAIWELPVESAFCDKGSDWLQMLLSTCSDPMRLRVLLLLWHCWHLRNNIVHGDGKASINESVGFLERYDEEIMGLLTDTESNKGKGLINCVSQQIGKISVRTCSRWQAPAEGTVKINADTSFRSDTGHCLFGDIAQNSTGVPFLSLSRRGNPCSCIEEAEAQAALSGLGALLNAYHGPIIMEMDNAMIARELQPGAEN